MQLFYVSFVQKDGLAASHHCADRARAEKLFNYMVDWSPLSRYVYVAWGIAGEAPQNEWCGFYADLQRDDTARRPKIK